MNYDKEKLWEWARMEHCCDYLDRNGALTDYASEEGFRFLLRKYETMVEERIAHCKELLKTQEDYFLYYLLAELLDKRSEERAAGNLYKRHVKYYALKSLEFKLDYEPPKKLLQRVKEWTDFLGGDRGQTDIPDLNVSFPDEGDSDQN